MRTLPLVPAASDAAPELSRALRQRARPASLVERRADGLLRCTACAHGCVLGDGKAGACGVRFRDGDELLAPFGYVARKYVRPVETNTIYHVLPGAAALTFGMFGCDLRCPYCHNHKVSQALREGSSDVPFDIGAEALVEEAVGAGCQVICAAYNEPMIAAEWVRAVFERAKERGLVTAIVSDGNATAEVLRYVAPVTDVYRVDLKAATEAQYKELGGRLSPVLGAIETARALGLWVEVVTLVVPGFNDDSGSLKQIASELVRIDPSVPWHLNAMMPRYKLEGDLPTPPLTLMTAVGAAYARGMRFVYASNLLVLAELSHTRCEQCRQVLVERYDYTTRAVRLEHGACPTCRAPVPGIWQRPA